MIPHPRQGSPVAAFSQHKEMPEPCGDVAKASSNPAQAATAQCLPSQSRLARVGSFSQVRMIVAARTYSNLMNFKAILIKMATPYRILSVSLSHVLNTK